MLYNVTGRLREYLAKTYGLGADASETAVHATVSRAMENGELSIKQLRELTAPVARITEFSTKFITPGMRAVLIEHYKMAKSASDEQAADFLFQCFERRQIDLKTIREIVKHTPDSFLSDGEKAMTATNDNGGASVSSVPSPSYSDVMATAAKAVNGDIRVKTPSEMYCDKKSTAVHVKWKTPVFDEYGRQVCHPSQAEFAKAGALLKLKASKDKLSVALSEPEKALLEEMYAHDSWCGLVGNEWQTGITGADRVKALLNDSTSGGQHVVPEWFDTQAVTFPLLTGELFPLVDLVPVPRGNKVDGSSVGNPSVAWGTAEGTAISLFDTASLIAELDTNIHPITAAIEVGRDFLADSVVDIGKVLMANIGQAMAEELDRVIALGTGTNQPEGLLTASGLTNPTAANGNAGPPTVADYEGLMFAIGKQYRTSANRNAFIANDTTYSRARGIAVGSTDARRVFGMNEQSYELLEFPFKIQNDIANTQIVFGAMAKYRMYRRQAVEMRWEVGGDYLSRTNKALLIVRGRYGGRVMDTSAFAKITNAQS